MELWPQLSSLQEVFLSTRCPCFFFLWSSCTNAPIMARRLFVPTSYAGQTRHPFHFGQSGYWSPLSVASFSLLERLSVAARENTLRPIIWAPLTASLKSRQVANIDIVLQSGEKPMHRRYFFFLLYSVLAVRGELLDHIFFFFFCVSKGVIFARI